MEKGLRQAELAGLLGVSPSYLNLIEHDRRRIGRDMLGSIAEILQIEPDRLSATVDAAMVDSLVASTASIDVAVELDKVVDLAIRFPGWSKLLTAQAEKIGQLESRIEELSDRMTHDPLLSSSLHEVISSATSIRSTASILNGDDQLDSDWQKRFHKNLHADAIRLAQSSDALISYLEVPEEGTIALSPIQEAEDFLQLNGFFLKELEGAKGSVDAVLDDADLSSTAATVLRPFLEQYQSDAKRLPMSKFEPIAVANVYDPSSISRETGVSLSVVLRRLASLPLNQGHPPIGLIHADGAGVLGISKHLPGIVFPRSGACPLWPIYTSLGQPGRPVQSQVALPGTPESIVLCVSIAEQLEGGIDRAPLMNALMLMMPDPARTEAGIQDVGPTCRICPRENCRARREPSVIKSPIRKVD